MNRLNRTLYLLPILLVAIGCGRHEGRRARHDEAKVTISRSWPAAEIRELRVFEIDGSVKIDAADVSEITLVATAEGDLELKKDAENQGLFTTEVDGDTLRIGRKEHRRGRRFNFRILFGHHDMRIHYALKVPASLTLDVNTVNGRIVTRGGEGETEASTVNGTIDIETSGAKELSATTVNGRVRAKFTRDFQGAQFKTVNGGVEAYFLRNASFNVDLSQVNGDFEAAYPLNIRSNPGSRRVSGDVNGGTHDLKIVTVNGDVELAQLNGSL